MYHGYLAHLYSLILHLIVRGSQNLFQPTQGLHLLALLYIVHVWMPWWLSQSKGTEQHNAQQTHGETNNYNLRNSYNISQTTNRLSISQQSFFLSTTKLWNLLDLRIRQLSTFESFKYKLKQHYYKNAKPPSYYNIGNRYLNILHTRIRNNCSALHNDLFHANLIHSPSCSCGYSTENAEHFFIVLQ